MAALLRYCGYFILGMFLGLLPALFSLAIIGSAERAWKLPLSIILCFGAVFCVLGILTAGGIFSALFRIFGRHVDYDD